MIPLGSRRYFSIFALCFLYGCGSGVWSYTLRGTEVLPEARGRIQIEHIEGGHRLITLSLTALPPPSRLGPGVHTYVLFSRNAQGQCTREGVLNYDAESRSARLTATSADPNFLLLVSGEADGSALTPSENQIVFQQAIDTP